LTEGDLNLICQECGAVSDESANRWQAHLGLVDEMAEDEEPTGGVLAYVFCPSCAEREFGTNGDR
jgi:hypothetical protein